MFFSLQLFIHVCDLKLSVCLIPYPYGLAWHQVWKPSHLYIAPFVFLFVLLSLCFVFSCEGITWQSSVRRLLLVCLGIIAPVQSECPCFWRTNLTTQFAYCSTTDETRVREFGLKKMWRSPNGTIRNILNGQFILLKKTGAVLQAGISLFLLLFFLMQARSSGNL